MSSLVEVYQALVWKELKEKLEPAGWNFEAPSTYLTEADLASYRDFIRQLETDGKLIRYGNGFRTAHVDLLYRLTKIRYFRHRTPIPLEYDLSVTEEPVPDYGTYSLRDVLRRAGITELEANLMEQVMHEGDHSFKGFSTYQQRYIDVILRGAHKYFGVVAPTASGKSLVFFIPVMVKAIQRVNAGRPGVSSVVMYPRKALASDQLQHMLRIIDILNRYIGDRVTVAIDDSDTRRMERELKEKTYVEFRGLTCPRYIFIDQVAKACGRKLLLLSNGTVECEAGHSFNYLIARRIDMIRNKPLILITNIWRAYYMMLKKDEVDLLQDLDIVVMDESHVYTGYTGGHIALILRLLRFLSSKNRAGVTPVFIFSSATISNPRQFLANLAGISEEELFLEDYRSLTPSSAKKRLLIHLYLLPAPEGGSAETLAEAIMEAVCLWCHKHRFKSIAFADSVSTVTTFWSYFHDTILSPKREAREIIDHVFDQSGKLLSNPDDDYSWYTLTPNRLSYRDGFKTFLLEDYKRSIDIHYGSLTMSERAIRELKLKQGFTKLVIATSTLELGIDLSDVAVIIQYKLPITPEGVSQRIGRGGRIDACYRISIGIVILPTSPIGTLYMYNRELREKLEKVEALPPLRIGERSENLVLMHVLTMLLLMRNLEGKNTFLRVRSVKEAADACRELRLDLPRVLEFNRKVRLLEERLLNAALEEIGKALEFSDEPGYDDVDIESTIQKLEDARSVSFNAWMCARDILQRWPSALGTPHDLLRDLERLLGCIQTSLKRSVEDLKDAVNKKELPNLPKIELSQLPDPDEASDELSIRWLGGIRARTYRDHGVTREVFSNKVNELIDSYRQLKEKILPEALLRIKELNLRASSFSAIVNRSLRRKIQEEIQAEQEAGRLKGISIFKLMGILMAGRRIFSPLLDQPLPKLRIEEQYA
ncbi:MAG: DEAD/DEAH box helicase [Nitrososphaerota archaeon]